MQKDDKLKIIQDNTYYVLKEFHNICQENDIKYILDYGTLLGAVRHQGFIPWDDDVDVAMPREEYNKLKKCFNNGYKNDLFLQTHDSDGEYFLPFAKIIMPSQSFVEEDWSHFNIKTGPWIDIFIYDNFPSDHSEQRKRILEFNKHAEFIKKLPIVLYKEPKNIKEILKNYYKKIKRFILSLSFVHKYYINKNTKKMGELLKTIDELIDTDSGLMINYSFKIEKNRLSHYLLKRDDFDERKLVQFEEDYFYISQNYDEILKNRYGNYMQLPPENQRKMTHNWVFEE